MDIRLKTCMEFVSGKGIACDVGTDHAYLAAELINSGKCGKVIASDIKEGPLESARKTIEKNNISDKIELVLSDGLEKIPLDGVSDIIIAGMGGETIADIISKADTNDIMNVRFILQPMTKPEILRKKLYEYQFEIISEKAVKDGDKIYTIICAEYNENFRYLTESESYAGFFEDSDPVGMEYREKESERLEKISVNLENSGNRRGAVHYHALSQKVRYGWESVKIDDIYNYLNELYPFDTQESWDNSGFLVECEEDECTNIVLSLDITYPVICEADCKGADLIISHHPVIFSPLKKIKKFSPVYELISREISAICMHTNLDIAKGGTNGKDGKDGQEGLLHRTTGIRLVGVGTTDLDHGEYRQMSLADLLSVQPAAVQPVSDSSTVSVSDHSAVSADDRPAVPLPGQAEKNSVQDGGREQRKPEKRSVPRRSRAEKEEALTKMAQKIRNKYGNDAIRRGM